MICGYKWWHWALTFAGVIAVSAAIYFLFPPVAR
jgi:hypothetical protein